MSDMTNFKPQVGSSFKKDKKTLIVSATAGDSFRGTPLLNSLNDQGYDGDAALVTNNKLGLCELYNKYIDPSYDMVVFVHDDVYIDSSNFDNKLYAQFKGGGKDISPNGTPDVLGLAGGGDVTVKKPLLWHLMTNKETQSGVVSHKTHPIAAHEKFRDMMYSHQPTAFGYIGRNVTILDGLFLAVQPRTLIAKGVEFDENLKGFHHYDIKFCVDCVRAGLILRTAPIHVIHDSPGLMEYTEDFLESQEYLYNTLLKYAGR